MVDSQSFPLQVPGFLELSEHGAYSPSSVYTPDDVKDIVAYGGAVCGTLLGFKNRHSEYLHVAWN